MFENLNKITAILELLDTKVTIVSLDVMRCQRTIAHKILERGVDYIITLKANQGRMFKTVPEYYTETCLRAEPAIDRLAMLLMKVMAARLDAGFLFARRLHN